MFRAVLCSPSGGHIVLLQRTESALNRRTVWPLTESEDARCCNNTI